MYSALNVNFPFMASFSLSIELLKDVCVAEKLISDSVCCNLAYKCYFMVVIIVAKAVDSQIFNRV